MSRNISNISIYWQGGEVFTMKPEWYMRALGIINQLCEKEKLSIINHLQTNLIGYNRKWNKVIENMFNNEISSSLDFPNLYRKTQKGTTNLFNDKWRKKFSEAKLSGIIVNVIAIPNAETFKMDASAFYAYYVEEVGVKNIQINTPFPGNPFNSKVNPQLVLENEQLGYFYIELLDIWLKEGLNSGVSFSPFKELIDFFMDRRDGGSSCIWSSNCSDQFLCIDPNGNVSQCDCWVTSYPEFRFGNILESDDLSVIMKSNIRDRFKQRASQMIKTGNCVECEYLAICHGGCPVRAYSTYNSLQRKDPYCESYKIMFDNAKKAAIKLSRDKYKCKQNIHNLKPSERKFTDRVFD